MLEPCLAFFCLVCAGGAFCAAGCAGGAVAGTLFFLVLGTGVLVGREVRGNVEGEEKRDERVVKEEREDNVSEERGEKEGWGGMRKGWLGKVDRRRRKR